MKGQRRATVHRRSVEDEGAEARNSSEGVRRPRKQGVCRPKLRIVVGSRRTRQSLRLAGRAVPSEGVPAEEVLVDKVPKEVPEEDPKEIPDKVPPSPDEEQSKPPVWGRPPKNFDYKEFAKRYERDFLQNVTEVPRHCRWECVARVLTDIVRDVLLGSDSSCTMYPDETKIIPRILSAFGISMEAQEEVEQFKTEWGKGGHSSIMMRAYGNIRDRRGAILRVLREEFYTQLELPKPRDGKGDVFEEWKSKLAELKKSMLWRIDTEGEASDPWGAPPVHHSISRVLMGIRYDPRNPVTINLRQAGFFFYNLMGKLWTLQGCMSITKGCEGWRRT